MKLGYVSLPGRGANDARIAAATDHLRQAGIRLAGCVQTNRDRPGSHPCDMDLLVLPAGPVLRISQDLGAGSRGCRLNAGVLEDAVMHAARHLDSAEVLIVNKFGRLESEGRGFVPLVAEALARGLSVLVGVNGLNLPAFLTFAAGQAQALSDDPAAMARWLAAGRDVRRGPALVQADGSARERPSRNLSDADRGARHVHSLR